MSSPDLDTVERALQLWVVTASGLPGKHVIWSGRGGDRPSNPWISLKLNIGEEDDWAAEAIEDNPLVLADLVVTADASSDRLTHVAHALTTGDGPVQLTTTGVLPAGLELELDYWAVRINADVLQLTESFADAIASVPVVVGFADAGTGVHSIVDTDATLRAGAEIVHVIRSSTAASLSVQCYADPHTGNAQPMAILHQVAKSWRLPSVLDALTVAGIDVTRVSAIRDVGAVVSTTVYEPRAQMDVVLSLESEVSETDTIITNVDVTFDIEGRALLTFDVP